MRKITSLLMLFCAFVGIAQAQTNVKPVVSTGTEVYEYYVVNFRDQDYFVTTTNGLNGGAQQLGSANAFNESKAKVTFKLTADDKLYSTNTRTELILGYTTTVDAANSVQLFAADSEAGYTWKIESQNGSFSLSAGDSDNSWNMHGGKGANIGLYPKTDGGSTWVFVPANEAAQAKANEAKASYAPSADYYYQIKNKGRSNMLAANANYATAIATQSTADLNQLWAFEQGENGTFYLRNYGQGKYLSRNESDNNAWPVVDAANKKAFVVEISNFDANTYVIKEANGGNQGHAYAHDANWGADHSYQQIVGWEVVADASQWYLVKTDISTVAQEISVKYSFVYDGVEKYTQETTGVVGSAYPDITVSHPYGVSCAAKPAGTINASEAVGGVITKEIALTIGGLPFQYSDTYAKATWYFMNLKPQDDGKWYLGYAANQEYIPLGDGQKALPADGQDAYLWAFVGNPFDGYKIMNKAAGENMILSSSTNTKDGNTGANTHPVLTSLNALDGKNTYWIPTSASSYATNGFYLAQKDNSSNKMNARGGKLAYWNSGADAGSTFQVTTLATLENYGITTLLSDAGKVGFPKTSSAAYTELNRVNTLGQGRATVLDVENAVSAYKKASDIQLPVDGKAYTIANYSRYNEGTTRYLNYTAGSALSVSDDVNKASVFVCKQLSNGVYAFVTSDGKVLTWMNSGEGYKENDKFNGYSSEYGTTYSSHNDWNKITVKKNGTAEVDYGFLRMVARRSNAGSSFIIKGTDGTWDKAGDDYFFQTSGGYYSSAWLFNEVAHENVEAENFAVAKIGAKLPLETKTLGEGLGKYHYLVNGVENYTADALNSAKTAEEVNAIAATLTINQPKTGFYRIKSANANDAAKKNKYWQLNAESAMELGELNKLNSIVYYSEGKILLYGNGLYLNNYETQAAVGTEPTTWTILENAAVAGTYALRYEVNGANTGFLSDWSGLTYGLNDGNAAWNLEELTWLPIPVNAEAGWTSLYSPVELNPSYGGEARFEVYTVSNVSETYATLENKDVIPANTGVVLKLTDAGKNNIENGCVFLEINANGTNTATSVLLGTYADTYVAEDAYALGLVDGEVGFYTATKNFNAEGTKVEKDGVKWLNNGFKAYLPKTVSANALRFNFGGNTTAIESVLNNGVDANAPIYDLSGRRVNNAVKGGIYIQNGKKFIVK